MKLPRSNKIFFLISAFIFALSFVGCCGPDDPMGSMALKLIENSNPESINVNIINKNNRKHSEIHIDANSSGKLKLRSGYNDKLAILLPDTDGKYPYDYGFKEKDAKYEFVNDFVKIMIYDEYQLIITFIDNADLQNTQTLNFRIASYYDYSHTDIYIHRNK